MFTRMACACIDHNANANRPQKINRDGTPAFRSKVSKINYTHYLENHSKKILKVDRARRKEVTVKVDH